MVLLRKKKNYLAAPESNLLVCTSWRFKVGAEIRNLPRALEERCCFCLTSSACGMLLAPISTLSCVLLMDLHRTPFWGTINEIPSIEQIRMFCPETIPLNESLTFCEINQPAEIIFCFKSIQLTLTDATWIHYLKWIYCCRTAGRKSSTIYSDVTQNEVKSTVCDHSSNRWLACEVFVDCDGCYSQLSRKWHWEDKSRKWTGQADIVPMEGYNTV